MGEAGLVVGTMAQDSDGIGAGLKRAVVELAIFSAATNILLFAPPLYMIQVYDRVVPASSLDTLIYLSIIGAVALDRYRLTGTGRT